MIILITLLVVDATLLAFQGEITTPRALASKHKVAGANRPPPG
jgi:hypothetical protein